MGVDHGSPLPVFFFFFASFFNGSGKSIETLQSLGTRVSHSSSEAARVLVCGRVIQATSPSLATQERWFYCVVCLSVLDLFAIICHLL